MRAAPAPLRDWMAAAGVTISFLPTPLTESVLALAWPEDGALRLVLTGGDRLSGRPSPALPWRLVNNYGPTENTVVSTSAVVEPGNAGTPSIGRPIANTRIYVLDPSLRPAPVGVAGELYVGGDGLARGYLGRPALTAERFVPDPFSAEPGARLYRTGDRARWRADGEIEFMGRLDFQVKVRGHRIEPGEVEAALLSHPEVREAVVVARADGGETRLVAYVVPAAGAAPGAVELRGHLSARLPAYMVPAAFVALAGLPLTTSGKVDRAALPEPGAGAAAARAYVPPRDALELELVHAWEALLGVEPVGVHDEFFALGGHSLLAIRLLARVEARTGLRIPLDAIFTAGTPEGFARLLREQGGGGDPSPLVAIRPTGTRRPLFLVHAAGGSVLAYAGLARRLGPDQPVYGLRARGLADGERPHASIAEMAADYLQALRAVQPRGPYHVAGWSMGAVIALEIARQLEDAGEAVALLAAIDPALPGPDAGAPTDEPALLRHFARDLGVPAEDLDTLPAEAWEAGAERSLGSLLEHARVLHLVPPDLDLARLERMFGVFRAGVEALGSHVPAPFGGEITLILAGSGDLARASARSVAWERLAGRGATVRSVPGDHFTLLREPHVEEVAKELARRLDADPPPQGGGPSGPPPSGGGGAPSPGADPAADERDAPVRAVAVPAATPGGLATLHDAFSARAALAPGAVAVGCEGEALTYAALEERANRLAHHLRRLGVGPEVRVGVALERSLELVVAILGVLKAGGAYVPVDPAYPPERIALTLADCGAPVLVTREALLERLGEHGARAVCLDRDGAAIAAGPAGAPAPGAGPANLAYVIYTSGSTGRPKGVEVTHANALRLFTATAPWFGFGADDVWTLFHSFAFDFSVWEIWGALLHGGRLVVVPWRVSRSPEAFYALLEAEGVTVLNQTPAAFRQLARADEEAAGRGAMRALALRRVIFGGEALEPATLRGWVERRGDARPRLVNMYGITETTVHVTWREITRDDVRAGSSSPIGVPIPDLVVHLLDERGDPVADGAAGEVYVGGAGVARGYLGRAALTAGRFVPDPFSPEPSARLYRSGDRARRAADGSLEFAGRADDQLKVRGFRIEPGEIEAVLLEHPAVREAVVLARGRDDDDRRLVAWVAAAGAVGAADLRAHAAARLPEFMVPAAVVLLDRFPLTPTGKVDRAALPDPGSAGTADPADAGDAGAAAPRTATEAVLAEIWARVLGVERVGTDEGFFALGGHSLLATQAVLQARGALGVDIPLDVLFDTGTVAALAAWVDARREGGEGGLPPIRRAPRGRPLPLTPLQEHSWFQQARHPGDTAENTPLAVHLRGPLDAGALERSVGELLRRHEALRTTFAVDPETGSLVQRIGPVPGRALARVELGALDPGTREAEARRVVAGAAGRSFDLARGPARMALLRLDEGEWVLLVVLHHIVTDGWSRMVMERELSALYAAFRAGRPSPLPEPRVRFADYAAWLRTEMEGELRRQLAWWRERLRGARWVDLAAGRPDAGPARAGMRELAVRGEALARLRRFAAEEGCTPFAVVLAAFYALVFRLTGQDDVATATAVSGRTRPEVEDVVGFFAHMAALRADLSGNPGFREVVRRVWAALREAQARQDVAFFERLGPQVGAETLDFRRRSRLHVRLVPADGGLSLEGVRAEPLDGAGDLSAGAERFVVVAGEREIRCVLKYRAHLLPDGMIENALEQLAVLIDRGLADPAPGVGDVPLRFGGDASASARERLAGLGLELRADPADPSLPPRASADVEAAERAPSAPVRPLRCLLLGEGAVFVHCAELLRERGHEVRGAVSHDPAVLAWAAGRGIRGVEPGGLAALAGEAPFDLLVSAHHRHRVPAPVLALARWAVNYHPAPLPRYAGVNPVPWALLEGEETHGVTWHLMNAELDAGDVLKQRVFAVRPDDTALSLSLRCHAAAVGAFAELLEELERGEVAPRPQDPRARSYVGLDRRPPSACVLSWERGAAELGRMTRALDFGPNDNPLGTPKVELGGALFLVDGLRVAADDASAPPGTVTAAGAEGIRVATARGEVVLEGVRRLTGEPVSLAEAAAALGVAAGCRLPGDRGWTRAGAVDAAFARHEAFWVDRLAAASAPIPVPGWDPGAPDPARPLATEPFPLPREGLGDEPAARVVAAFTAYLAGVARAEAPFDLAYGHPALREAIAGLEALFSPTVPLRVAVDRAAPFAARLAATREEITRVERRGGYLRDVAARYTWLRAAPAARGGLAVGVERVARLAEAPEPEARLALVVADDGEACWRYDPGVLSGDDVRRLGAGVAALLAAAAGEGPVDGAPGETRRARRKPRRRALPGGAGRGEGRNG
ncbi:MAG TPA: amino acid adenylation domain-containing protein [Longimicrobium sp.]|nr:amino acid adenylation domain-containing protein [Longimicrobium sp.]